MKLATFFVKTDMFVLHLVPVPIVWYFLALVAASKWPAMKVSVFLFISVTWLSLTMTL